MTWLAELDFQLPLLHWAVVLIQIVYGCKVMFLAHRLCLNSHSPNYKFDIWSVLRV